MRFFLVLPHYNRPFGVYFFQNEPWVFLGFSKKCSVILGLSFFLGGGCGECF